MVQVSYCGGKNCNVVSRVRGYQDKNLKILEKDTLRLSLMSDFHKMIGPYGLRKNYFTSIIELVFKRNGFWTACKHITEVLEYHIMTFIIIMSEHGIILQDDYRTKICSQICQGYLEEGGMGHFVCPVFSSDYNLIEHVLG